MGLMTVLSFVDSTSLLFSTHLTSHFVCITNESNEDTVLSCLVTVVCFDMRVYCMCVCVSYVCCMIFSSELQRGSKSLSH